MSESIPNTHIHFVLDRSGSMETCLEDTIGGVNSFLRTQKELKDGGNCTISLYLFDHEYNVLYNEINVQDAKELDHTTYVPRGHTALHDAIGKTVLHAAHCKYDPKDKIVIVILTDGFENASREFDNKSIAALIKKYDALDNWSFVFLAANQDSITTAKSLGIGAAGTMDYVQSGEGVRKCYNNLSAAMSRYRTATPAVAASSKIAFTEEERQDNATV